MAGFRFSFPYFQVANPNYVNARVTIWTVDGNGAKTGTRANLYSGPTGSTQVSNPFQLDSEGKQAAPVYADEPVIATVDTSIESHDTAIVAYTVRGRGLWAPSTIYAPADIVSVPNSVTPNAFDVAIANVRHTSSASFVDDLDDGLWTILVDASAIVDEAVAQATSAAAGYTNDAQAAAIQAIDAKDLAEQAADEAEAARDTVISFSVNAVAFTFDGDGVTTSFVLPAVPPNQDALALFIGGLYSRPPAWSLAGNTVTFSSPPPTGARMVTGFIGARGITLDAESKFQHLAWEIVRLGFEKLGRADAAAGYQPLDADLTAIAALVTTSFGRSLLTQADAVALRSTAGLEIGLGPSQQAPNWATLKS